MKTIFNKFKQLESFFKFETTLENENQKEIHKMFQTGGLKNKAFDYDRGFLAFNISLRIIENKYKITMNFISVDDTDYGTYIEFNNKQQTDNFINSLIEILEPIISLPTEEELNELVRKLGIYFCNL